MHIALEAPRQPDVLGLIDAHDAYPRPLYERAGFVRCGPFGGCIDDPLSVFMSKLLG